MYDVFISYRRKQGFAVAKMFSGLLKAKGISSFVDLDELRSGTFDDKILLAIESSPAFLLILTQGALDRCSEEGDWLSREILAAVDSGRNIIPVLCDGFEWPKEWDEKIDDRIRYLSKYNSVIMSYEYIDATVNKIAEYVNEDKLLSDTSSAEKLKNSIIEYQYNEVEDFFRKNMENIESVEGVDFAFHAGSVWHQDIARLDILTALADAGVKIRVIVNTPEMAEIMSKNMRHKLKSYISFDEAISLWKKVEAMYDNVEVRISEIPILRIHYSFRMKDKAKNSLRIKYYTHGNAKINDNFSQNFFADDRFYELYCSEFEFLWKNANV